MKIAFTSYSLPPNDSIGAGVQNHYLANEFVKCGHVVTMYSPHASAPIDALYKHVQVRLTGKLQTLKWSIALAKIDFSGYEYLHCSGDDHFIKTNKRTCHLRQYHGNSLSECRYARTATAKLRNILLYTTELASGVRADLLTCVSTRAAKVLPPRTVIIPCGVDLSTFTPGGRKTLYPSVLFVGVLESRKRGDLLVDSFITQVKSVFPSAVLNVVREEKKSKHKDVFVHGFVDQDYLIDLYTSSWIFCLPSSYEGFGVPYIEAMACGTAVVATPNDGSLEVLDDGKYGILSTPATLGADIVSLLGSPKQLRTLEVMGIERSTDYSWSNVVSKYIDLVKQYHG
jgi:glycosyltransferase involved in cell wall biosynthesis